MRVALKNIPHHSQHTGVSHCHSNVCHSTACHSSRNKSCRPGVHGRYCRRNKLGATVYRIRPFQHRWLGLPPSYSVCSSSRTERETSQNNLVIQNRCFSSTVSEGIHRNHFQEKSLCNSCQTQFKLAVSVVTVFSNCKSVHMV